MSRHNESASQNALHVDISSTQTCKDTKYKIAKMKEIISAICALFNSGGGKLDLQFENNAPNGNVDSCDRMIEQHVIKMVGEMTMSSRIKFDRNTQGIISLLVQKARKLVTVNYNLYIPSGRQVIAVSATEPAEEIKEILQRKIVEGPVSICSHLKQYRKGQKSGLHEDYDIQLKKLKSSSTKCVTLADRITGKNNKLTLYVSAFANRRGGHIYYGIYDHGMIEGEVSTEKEKEEIIKKVTKTISKMVWPVEWNKPQKGEQWDIFFEPVVDAHDNPIPSTFVIVIYIAPCPGGVFVQEPESYHIVKSEVQRMSFEDWWRNFIGVRPVPSHVARVCWSSEKNRTFFWALTNKLIQYYNNKEMEAFGKLSEMAIQKFPDSDAHLIVMAEKVMIAGKHLHFEKAESLIEKIATTLIHSEDRSIFEVRMLLLKCMIERVKGNYEASYQIAQRGLQMMQSIPVELYTVWFYIQAAMVATILSTKQHDLQKYRVLKDSARQYLDLAARDENSLEDLPSFKMSDARQKLYIYQAWVVLGCSITGDVAEQNGTTSCEDIEEATRKLLSVSESVLKGNPLTHYRKVHYHLAECDLLRRRSEVVQEDCVRNLKQAYECGTKARDLAIKHKFDTIVNYANKRLADLTVKLLLTRGGHTSKEFCDLEY